VQRYLHLRNPDPHLIEQLSDQLNSKYGLSTDDVLWHRLELNLAQAYKWLGKLKTFIETETSITVERIQTDSDEYARPTFSLRCSENSYDYGGLLKKYLGDLSRLSYSCTLEELLWHGDPYGYANTLFLVNDDNPAIHCEWNPYWWEPLGDLSTPNDVLRALDRLARKNESAYGPQLVSSFICIISELQGGPIHTLPAKLDWSGVLKKHKEFYRAFFGLSQARINLSPRLRHQVLERDGFRCCDCGASPQQDDVTLEVDHRIAVANGGTNDIDNLRTLCRPCNAGKSARRIAYPEGHR
jgi:hypothetical protein